MKKHVIILAVFVAASLLFSQTVVAQDGWLQNKIRQKMLQRLNDQPEPKATAKVTDKITKTGDYTFAIDYAGLRRYYTVHVPASYSPATPAPLLFALHGGGGDMGYMARDEFYGQISKSEDNGHIVVFPNG